MSACVGRRSSDASLREKRKERALFFFFFPARLFGGELKDQNGETQNQSALGKPLTVGTFHSLLNVC